MKIGNKKLEKSDMQPDWVKTYLGDEIALLYGRALPKSDRTEGKYPVFGSNGIVGYHNEALVKGPGIIIGRKGSCGAVHFSTSDFWPIDTTYYIALRKDHDWRFMDFFLSTFGLNEMNSHSTIPGLNRENVYKLKCHIPRFPEQQKIAAVLFKIQKAIEIQESIIEKTRELKKSTLHHVFTHGLLGEKLKETEIGPIPESWSVQRFEEFATLHRGYDLPIQDRTGGSVPIVGSNGIVGYHDQSKVKGPGVVTGRSGSIGISYYVEGDYWPLNTGLYVEDFHRNDSLYVHYFFQLFDFGQYAAGVSVPTLNRNIVHATLISVPQIVEQKEIANILKTIDQKINLHKVKKSTLQDLFKTMLNKLMTGEIRVKDLEMELLNFTV